MFSEIGAGAVGEDLGLPAVSATLVACRCHLQLSAISHNHSNQKAWAGSAL